MSALQYHSLWMGLALALIAVASAVLAWRARVRDARRLHAEEALDLLARYSLWLAAWRRLPGFDGEGQQGLALARLRDLQQASFPELAEAMAQLLEMHGRILDFLWRQELLRLRDPEAWLESDHDARFMGLWRQHRESVHAIADRLRGRAGQLLVDAEPESVFPA
jgi:hypothetical protein